MPEHCEICGEADEHRGWCSNVNPLVSFDWLGHEMDPMTDRCTKCDLPVEAMEDWSARCGQVWVRQRKMILDLRTGKEETFRSKNAAKLRSRELQMGSAGWLGSGILRVVR